MHIQYNRHILQGRISTHIIIYTITNHSIPIAFTHHFINHNSLINHNSFIVYLIIISHSNSLINHNSTIMHQSFMQCNSIMHFYAYACGTISSKGSLENLVYPTRTLNPSCSDSGQVINPPCSNCNLSLLSTTTAS